MTCVCFSCNRGISWVTKDGVQHANYFGSLTQASTCRIGSFSGEEIYVPFKSLLPMVFSNLQCTTEINLLQRRELSSKKWYFGVNYYFYFCLCMFYHAVLFFFLVLPVPCFLPADFSVLVQVILVEVKTHNCSFFVGATCEGGPKRHCDQWLGHFRHESGRCHGESKSARH